MKKIFFLFFLYFSFSLFAKDPLIIELQDPIYKNGEVYTSKGGVIHNKDFRLQAQAIEYIHKEDTHFLKAQGNLVLQYKNRVFVGDELEYDFKNKSGVIYNGKTLAYPWYIGGEVISLHPDGSYSSKNVFFTTGENVDSSWDIIGNNVSVSKDDLMKVKHITFRLFKFPVFYLPYYRMNLKKFTTTPIIRYQLGWDKGAGPKISLRYQVFSWKDFALYLRGEWRLSRGLGGAVETTYYSPDKNVSLETKNYLATDVLPNDPERKQRYRLQGAYHFKSFEKTTHIDLTWDKYTDIHMPGDFKSPDFEIDTARSTIFSLNHVEDLFFANVYVHPKVNPFESIKQDLPTVSVSTYPISVPYLGIITNCHSKLSYLDFTYSKDLSSPLNDMHSIRLESFSEIYRPFYFSPITITPIISATGLYYSNRPTKDYSNGLGSIFYGGNIESNLKRQYSSFKHIIHSYVYFEGYSNPTLDNDKHYIFSINDGFNRLNMFTLGCSNKIYPISKCLPSFDIDIFGKTFLGHTAMGLTSPYLFCNITGSFSNVNVTVKNEWNFNKNVLDYFNIIFGWTICEDFALNLEYRYRSKYFWRKADRNNYILDVTRRERDLLMSPLSNYCNTILSNIFFRFNPFWTCHIQSLHGWAHHKHSIYNECKIDLTTLVFSSWKLCVSYLHTQTDDRINFSISLMKKHKTIPLL